MTSPFTISSVRDAIFVMLGVLLRKLVAADRGQDLSAVESLGLLLLIRSLCGRPEHVGSEGQYPCVDCGIMRAIGFRTHIRGRWL